MNRNSIGRRMDDVESRMASRNDHHEWIPHIIIGGVVGSLNYVQNIRTGQRIFDPAFVNQITQRDRHAEHVDFNVRLGMPADEYQAILRDAVRDGIITNESNIQHAGHFSDEGETDES